METVAAVARTAVVESGEWQKALQVALAQVSSIEADVAVLFASPAYAEHFPAMLAQVQHETGAHVLLGCCGQGVIGPRREVEDSPALSVMAVALPGATLTPVRFDQSMIESCATPADWRRELGVPPDDVNAWLLFSDPFTLDTEKLIQGIAGAYPGLPMLGGLASAGPFTRRTFVFLNGEVYADGGVGLAIGGAYTLLPLVSQGCEPIGQPWTITSVQQNIVETISNRPAYERLVQTFQAMPDELKQRAQRNLLVGLAADEYRDTFERGSFLIRNLMGVEQKGGGIAIGALPRVGQTIQFQMRDAATADLDLRALLDQTRRQLGDTRPIAAVLCTCNGRGVGLFGIPNHDASAIARAFDELPLAGLFCNGEIGPVGTRPFLHGFTASLALIVPRPKTFAP